MHAWRLPAAAVAQLVGAHLRGLEAFGMAAFWVLDGLLVGSRFVSLVMHQGQSYIAVKIQEVSPASPPLFVHSTPVLLY